MNCIFFYYLKIPFCSSLNMTLPIVFNLVITRIRRVYTATLQKTRLPEQPSYAKEVFLAWTSPRNAENVIKLTYGYDITLSLWFRTRTYV